MLDTNPDISAIMSIEKELATLDKFLIVGLGVAGAAMAHTLRQRGIDFLVVEAEFPNTPSRIAAGLMNPITGKNYVKSNGAENYFPFFHAFYQEVESSLQEELEGRKFFFPQTIYRPFRSVEEQNIATARSGDEGYQKFLGTEKIYSGWAEKLDLTFGYASIEGGAWLDAPLYLQATRKALQKEGKYIQSEVSFADLVLDHNTQNWNWNGEVFKGVFWCTGATMALSEQGKQMGFAPVKGEILSLKLKQDLPAIALTTGHYLLGEGQEFKYGATFNWRDLTSLPTAEAREELLQHLQETLKSDYEITSQQGAIRPAVRDRRPLVGSIWPEIFGLENYPTNGQYMLNGLGTKGLSMAPYLAHLLWDFHHSGTPIPEQYQAKRWWNR